MAHLYTRRIGLNRKGRPMVLSRALDTSTTADVTVQGFLAVFRPNQIAGDIRQGDAQVNILNDEIAATGWPGPPRARDTMQIDGVPYAVLGAQPLYEGAVCIGHTLWVRGS